METEEWERVAQIECDSCECGYCRGKPIPAEIAEKLGIKPKEGKS